MSEYDVPEEHQVDIALMAERMFAYGELADSDLRFAEGWIAASGTLTIVAARGRCVELLEQTAGGGSSDHHVVTADRIVLTRTTTGLPKVTIAGVDTSYVITPQQAVLVREAMAV